MAELCPGSGRPMWETYVPNGPTSALVYKCYTCKMQVSRVSNGTGLVAVDHGPTLAQSPWIADD